ncbi:malate dehydrogenase [Microbotryum lychnidis-dioicae p1A1 Lamole]|uniref:Malate dehydrogenase n=2 Tax=Microbotryum TaxID=34416 RepID=U5HIM0_USTV1|nr:malate dehydrogenase [Microbotryum lychnidis-dioicae p1A1 Lamole]SGY20415.1 BQ5605_C016g08041 [Microbotryum silenes-dioicae]|eukprot:KDE02587.1 malate dehydrogenase [Microbotryum lychnidis-dioicae p1A1 Lamole]
MISPIATRALGRRAFSTSRSAATKVAVLGAAGGIGQPLSLLLKLNPRVTELSLYDIRGCPGVAADLSHVNTPSPVAGYAAENNGLEKALTGAEVIIIPAGMPRKPGMTRDDLFNTNASIVRDLAIAAAKVAPKARIGIIANPVNSTVPIVAEVFKKAGVYDPKRLFGVTTLDIVRASAFVSGIAGTHPKDTNIPVVGGHSGVTIVPLFSQTPEGKKIVEKGGEELAALVKRTQFGGDEVVKAKDGAGSATLSMAYAGAEFTDAILRAIDGEKNVTLCTYVESPLYAKDGVDFFSSPVTLNSEGIVGEIHPVGKLHPSEEELLKACLPDLAKNIKAGVDFVAKNPGN